MAGAAQGAILGLPFPYRIRPIQSVLVDLVTLAHRNQLVPLDEAWNESLQSPVSDVEVYVRTFEVLCEADMAGKALSLGMAMIEALAEKDRVAHAARLASSLVELGIHTDAVLRRWFELVELQFSKEDWFELLASRANLSASSITANALKEFTRLRCYTTSHVIYHPAGWGAGVVEEFRTKSRELVVRFKSDRRQEVPLQSALDSMRPLDEDDLRSMLLIARDELERLATDAPAVLIRKAAKLHRGTISSSEVKALLCPDLVPTKKWPTFWKRAKAAATVDPYLRVDGSNTRPTFVLRKNPLSVVEEAQRDITIADSLGDEIAVTRSYLERCQEEGPRGEILDAMQERIEAALSGQRKASHPHILDGMLLLEAHGRSTSVPATQEVAVMLIGEDGRLQPEMFDQLATQEARDHAVDLLDSALGERWAELCIEALPRFPTSVVERVLDLLLARGERNFLIELWDKVAPYPRRHPVLTYLAGRAFADGVMADLPGGPDSITVARVLLHLCRTLSADRIGNAQLGRLQTRLTSLLAGRRAFLSRALEIADRDTMASFLGIAERAGRDFPNEVSTLILRAVAKRFPDLTEAPDRPFWEQDTILVTKAGLESQRAEYRLLVDGKIPANSEAIGHAAALGDLSENSEWESAMEEQRNLTARASMMDADLRKARLIEDQPVTDHFVCPGTEVTYTELDTGKQKRVKVLGPWDMVDSGEVLNYRAPAAAPLLGCVVGETAELIAGTGTRTVRIDEIVKIV